MTSGSTPDDDLRRSAESRLNGTPQPALPLQAALDAQRLVHELQVHQIELELQNEELRASRAQREALLARYTELYDFAPVGYFTLARDGTILQTNLLGASLLGIERSNLQGRRFGLFVEAAQRPCFNLFMEQVFTGQPRLPCELQLGAEGNAPLLVDMKATLAPDGQTCHAVAVNITARKLAEAELRISEERLAMALAGSGLGLWDWEVKSDRVVCDERWPATLGYAAGELPSSLSDWKLRVHPDDLAAATAALGAHLNGDTGEYESEHRVRHKNGHWIWLLARGKVIARNAAGEPLRMAGTFLDISHNKRLARESSGLLQKIEGLLHDAARVSKPDASTGTPPPGKPSDALSRRQKQILKLIASGCTSADIAVKLEIAPLTVAAHRRELMRKLDLHSVADLTRFAIQERLLDD